MVRIVLHRSYASCSTCHWTPATNPGTHDLARCTWANDLYQREGLGFIRRHAHGPKPFFLYLSTTTPHAGFLSGQHSAGGWPVPDAAGMAKFNADGEYESWPQTMKNVSAAIWAQDLMVGAVNGLLDTLKIKEQTVLFFAGDNGPPAGRDLVFFNSQGPFRGYKSTLHDGGVRQSVIVQWLGKVKAGARNKHHM
jgi:arylsulfatase A